MEYHGNFVGTLHIIMSSRFLVVCFACILHLCFGLEGNGHLLPREGMSDDEPDRICGLHPVDILMSSLLQNTQSNDSMSVLMLSNAITSLYRTQPDFYAFLMRCTTAWNRCQRARLQWGETERGLPPEANKQSWKLLCVAGLTLPQPEYQRSP